MPTHERTKRETRNACLVLLFFTVLVEKNRNLIPKINKSLVLPTSFAVNPSEEFFN